MSKLLNVVEFAATVGWKPATVRQKVWRREVEYIKIGRSIRFKPETAQKLIEAGNRARAGAPLTMFPDARDVARMVTMPELFRHFGWRLRPRSRADCGLCRGGSKGTLAYREHVWHCHRCGAGGDVFSLVRAINHCDFPAALAYVTELAGVRVDHHQGEDWRKQVAERKEHRERINAAANKLAQIDHALWVELRDRIHDCDRVLSTPGPWSEMQWQRAQAASTLRDDYLLSAYSLLSWGAAEERARYALHPELRGKIISDVRWAGYVRTADGKQVEVLAWSCTGLILHSYLSPRRCIFGRDWLTLRDKRCQLGDGSTFCCICTVA